MRRLFGIRGLCAFRELHRRLASDATRRARTAVAVLGALASAGCAELLPLDQPASAPNAGSHASSEPAPIERPRRAVLVAPVGQSIRAAGPAPEAQYAETDASALAQFHDVLEPFGTWEDDPSLGTVWFPSREAVGDRFVPYVSNGRWTYEGELVWVSDYAWGWAPFHYGRWAYAGPRGWAWIPGRRYGGAWVDWRTGDSEDFGYVGWGPTPPSWFWHGGQALRFTPTPAAAFVYCPASRFFAPGVAAHLVPLPDALAIAQRTRPYTRGVAASATRALLAFASTDSPSPGEIGIPDADIVKPPAADPGLQRAWMLARPSTAETAGIRPHLGLPPPRLKTWVIGAPKYKPLSTPRYAAPRKAPFATN